MGTQRTVSSVQELGDVIAVARIAQGIRTDELSASHVFVGAVEKGKETAQIGKVLALLSELGIRVILELPPGVDIPPETGKPRRRRISR